MFRVNELIERFGLEEMHEIMQDIEKMFRKEPIVIKRNDLNNLIIIGDLHGDLLSLKRIVEIIDKWYNAVVFLGDYVDRGKNSLETVLNAFYLKLEKPDLVFLLRGNHELEDVNSHYGFKMELISRFGSKGEELFQKFNEIFSQMPIAMIADDNKLIMLHGGIPIDAESVKDFDNIPKGIRESYENTLLLQILWNDPFEGKGYAPSFRGPGIYLFGEDIFDKFMRNSDAEMMVRAHQVFQRGYRYFFRKRLLSIFSSVNYVGRIIDAKIVKYEYGKTELISLLR